MTGARVIWIEILSRSGQVVARHRCTGPVLRIGRSYQSDVIIDDPTVAPDHLRITQTEDGAILVEAANPIGAFTVKGERRERSLVDGDTVLRIGHTALRLRDESYPVPAASVVVEPKPRWIALSALIVATLLINALTIWLDEVSEPRFLRDVGALVALAGAVLVWAAIWALLSRIFAGAARFWRHLAIATTAFLVYTIYIILAEAMAFSLSSAAIAGNLETGVWVVLGVACFLHLETIAPSHAWRKAAAVAVLVLAGIGVQVTSHIEDLKKGLQPSIARTSFPPAFRLARAKSEDQFFAAVGTLQGKLDGDRETP